MRSLMTVCWFGLMLLSGPLTGVLSAAERPPNIVFILADDLGYRELGCYGQQKIRTPHLDRLATQGLRFTQHYAGNAVCAPSRCVLLTGQHPGHAFVRNNRENPPEGQFPIPAETVTLTKLLQQRGYRTGAFGKWGLGSPDSSGEPLQQGVDRFFGYNCQARAHTYYPASLWSDREIFPLQNNPPIPGHAGLPPGSDPHDPRSYDLFKGQDYAPHRIQEAALEFIRQNQDRPFFLYYPSIIPHVALHVPDAELQQYLELGWHDPPFTREKSGYTPHFTPRAAYAAMISHLDADVGGVLALLDELGLAENTLVVFTSDNGATLLTEEVDVKFFNSVGELRGLKGSLYEGGIRVPCLVRWPGKTPAGTVTDFVSGFEDWLPTLLAAAGAAELVPGDVDGISLLPTLLGQKQPERPFLYREFAGYGGQQSVRVGRWKAIRQNLNRGQRPRVVTELYDLQTDPGEEHNVAAEQPEVLARLEAILHEQHVPSEHFPLRALDAAVR
jgi:arylsulfatase A-like enzyme